MVSLSAIQLCSVPNVQQNLDTIERLLSLEEISNEHIVVLPECCLYFGGSDKDQLQLARENQKTRFLQRHLAALAKKFGVYLVAGSIPFHTDNDNKFTNRCFVFSPTGDTLGEYDKIHLFDAAVDDGEKSYLESKYTLAGNSVSVVETESTKIGLTICYDLRFPELYRQLRNKSAGIITVPSAFTHKTGKAHWQALLQARAIENQVYVVAAGQQGVHANGRETWGHSMIISPWGEILACQPEGEGIVTSHYSQETLTSIRKAMPVVEHNKFESKLNTYE